MALTMNDRFCNLMAIDAEGALEAYVVFATLAMRDEETGAVFLGFSDSFSAFEIDNETNSVHVVGGTELNDPDFLEFLGRNDNLRERLINGVATAIMKRLEE